MDSKWQTALDIFRGSFGRTVVVLGNADGRNNGTGWAYGDPVGQINHHLVVGMDPDKTLDYVAMVRDGYSGLSGPIVQTMLGVQGTLYLIATGPCNHAGQGASSVVDRIRSGQPPAGPAASVGAQDDGVKNGYYTGTECQHPGDSTDYPDIMIDVLVDWNAALSIAFGWGDDGHACIQHYESTDRKIDTSWRGGPAGDGGPEMRRRVAARIAQYRNGTSPTQPEPPEDDMPLTDSDLDKIAERVWKYTYKDPDSSIGGQEMRRWVSGTRRFIDEVPARLALLLGARDGADDAKVRDWILQSANKVVNFVRGTGSGPGNPSPS